MMNSLDAMPGKPRTNEAVLYVDDDIANLTVFEAACQDYFAIATCDSPTAALRLMAEREFAVLLTDQRMPGMTGVQLAAKARIEFPDTIRILSTAYTEYSDAIDAINHGHVRSYIKKPWDLAMLRNTLTEAVELYRAKKQVRELERRLVETERVYALGVIAAGIAHELRNPLTVVSGMSDLIGMRVEALLGAPGIKQLNMEDTLRDLAQCSRDCRTAVDTMVEITRGIELSNRRTVSQDVSDLEEVVELTLRSVRGTLRKKGQVECSLGKVPKVKGNRTQLGQVVLNLVVNAIQALPDKRWNENFLRIRLGPSEPIGGKEFVKLEVEDTGQGMNEDVVSRIFDPFFTTKSDGGTGLGLAISKRIVDEIGGNIVVRSEIGKGTCFSVLMPSAG